MNSCAFQFQGVSLQALGSGAVWWAERSMLCVSDLHLGKSERMSRRSGIPAPPYEVHDTLSRLEDDIAATQARVVVCLGDSFDDLAAAAALPEEARLWITRLQAGRRWVWIEGNHDPGPIDLGGSHLAEMELGPLIFRHIAQAGARGEVSGHYHPKVQVPTRARVISRPAVLVDDDRIILPAYGTYTGGLRSDDPVLAGLMGPEARAIVTGAHPVMVAMPR
ncbi:MAG: ligase-associated DNA damage response endonuclease PdeM [Paracoccaceae bacterium]